MSRAPTKRALRDAAGAACDAWLSTAQGRSLAEMPIAPGRFSPAMANRLRLAFEAGYAAGVKAGQSPGAS